MTHIGILHFTDIHVGMHGLAERWPNIQAELFEDLRGVQEQVGQWDLVLFTGDLAYRGTTEDFEKVRGVLQKLWEGLSNQGSSPKLVAVPGNHDFARPEPSAATRVLQDPNMWADPELQREFWENDQSEYRAVISGAFDSYDRWSRDPGVDFLEPQTRGLLPGDFSATFEKGDVKLGLLGLNTTFLQLSDKMSEGSLAVDARQFAAACAPNLAEWVEAHDTCLLLTHQPPTWLRADAQNALETEVLYPAGRFAAHLCGHLHEARASSEAFGGARPRHLLQGASLFGLEQLGTTCETRIHGYSACRLDFSADQTRLQVWPRRASKVAAGGFRLAEDTRFTLNRNTGEFEEPWLTPRGGRRITDYDRIKTLQKLAEEYVAIRVREPTSRARSAQLEHVVAEATGTARRMFPAQAGHIAEEWLDIRLSHHGRHAVALAMAQALSDPELYERVMALLCDKAHRDCRFEQVQALKYLGEVLPSLSTERRDELRVQLPQIKQELEIGDTTDRGEQIKLLLRRLKRMTAT